jgi:hypothetical protein
MNLPLVATPEFTVIIPSTKEEVRFRPFLVKEEKLLLIALESNDSVEMARTIRKMIQSCIISDVNIDDLATFDIEYLFLQLRAKSVSEIIELRMRHVNSECKGYKDIKINVEELKVSEFDPNDKKIFLTEDIGVVVKFPSLEDVSKYDLSNANDVMNMIADCINYVFDKKEVYNEFTHKEIVDWLDQFKSSQLQNLVEFFNKIPKLEYDIEWECNLCGEKEKTHLEGLASFFT